MKRKILIIFLTLVCAFCLAFGIAACNNGAADGGTTNTEQSGGTTDDGTTSGNTDDGTTDDGDQSGDQSGDDQSGEQGDEQGDDQSGEQGDQQGDDQSGDVEVTVSLNYTQSGSGYVVSGIGNVESDTVTIPSTYNGLPVTGIAANAFSGNTVIVVIVIPESVTSIGNSAFSGCTSLTEVNIPEKVTTIGDNAFNGCTGLESVTLGSGVQTIGSGAFSGCVSLTVIVIGNGVTSIGANAFSGCTKLNNITIGSGVKSIGANAFSGCAVTEVNIPAGVTSIGANAFADCTKIVVIVILGNATINSGAFSGCTSLTTLTLADGLIASLYDILEAAFANSSLLTEVKDASGNAYHAHRLTHNAKVEATCTAAGSAENWYCSACDKYYSNSNGTTEVSKDSLTIAATDHTYTYKYDENGHWQECEVCGDTTASESHTFENNICTVCGYSSLVASENLAYTLSNDGTYYTVSGIGACSDTDIVIPSIRSGKPVTAIAANAFENQTQLTSVYVPDSVTSIGKGAFSGCLSLVSMTLPFVGGSASATSASSSTLFGYILGQTSNAGGTATKQYHNSSSSVIYYIPATLTTVTITGGNILYGAFYNCTALESVTIGSGVTSIGNSAFYNCTALENVIIGSSVTSIGSGAFSDTAYYNDSNNWENDVLYIGNYLITANSSISGDYTIKAGTTVIANYAFYNYTALTSITIPDSVTSIGDYAFYKCTALESITIPDSVTSIGESAFESCKTLTSITIPDSVTSIGDQAFRNCTALESITIGSGVTSIGDLAFGSTAYYNDSNNWEDNVLYIGNFLIKADTSISGSYTIKDGTTLIANQAFKNCSSLTSITIPDSVTSIGDYAFYECSKLTSVTFENTSGWYVTKTEGATSGTTITSSNLSSTSTAAKYLTSSSLYIHYFWYRSES